MLPVAMKSAAVVKRSEVRKATKPKKNRQRPERTVASKRAAEVTQQAAARRVPEDLQDVDAEPEIVYVVDLDLDLAMAEAESAPVHQPRASVAQIEMPIEGDTGKKAVEIPRGARTKGTSDIRQHAFTRGPVTEVILVEMPLDATTVEVRNLSSRTVELKKKPRAGGSSRKGASGEARPAKGVIFEMPLDGTTVEVRHFNSRTVELKKKPQAKSSSGKGAPGEPRSGKKEVFEMPLDAMTVEVRNLDARTIEVRKAPPAEDS